MNESEMKLKQANAQLQFQVNQLLKEKASLIKIIQANGNDIKAIENKINAKEKELMFEIQQLSNENFELKQEILLVNREKVNVEMQYKEADIMVDILKEKVNSLSKLIIENEKIRNELSIKLSHCSSNDNNLMIMNKLNDNSKGIITQIGKEDKVNTTNKDTPSKLSNNESKSNNSKHIWGIINDIKSHINYEQIRLHKENDSQ